MTTRSARRPASTRTAPGTVRDCLPGVRCNCPREYALCMTVRLLGQEKLKSDQFTWDRGIVAIASAEASELGLPARCFDISQRSAGFEMESHITGKKVLFHVVTEARDSENDIKYWEFKPVSHRSVMVPAMTVIVYND